MSLILNLIWIILGGWLLALGWFFAAILTALSIVLLPWSRACLAIGNYTLLPFGREAIDRRILTGQEDIGTSPLGFIGNLIWLVVFGWWLALGHIGSAILCALTVIGLPLAYAHLKLVGISLFPIGKAIVSREEAAAAYRRASG